MAKKNKPETDCAGFGIAFAADDDECDVCTVAEDCEAQTNDGDDGATTTSNKGKGAGKGSGKAAGKGKGKSPAPANDDNDYSADIAMLEERVDALEARVESLEEAVASGATKKGKSKMNKADKDAAKQALLDDAPYSATGLKELNGRQIKMLASALKINSFGMDRAEATKEIVKAQKKLKKK